MMANFCQFAFLIAQDGEGSLPTPQTVWQWTSWSWERSITLPLLVLLAWYLLGTARRGKHRGVAKRHFAFAAAWVSLALALMSPLHRLGDALFSAHMLQHEVILLLAAPLFAASQPGVTLLYAFRHSARKPVGSAIARIERIRPVSLILSPLSAFLLHAATLAIWHIPYLYQATLNSDLIHALQHLCFFASGVLFWSALYGAGSSSMTYGVGVLYVFGTAIYCSALGALLTFSRILWYPVYATRTEIWHLTPIQDQQLGGLLMWVPSSVVFIAIGVWLFAQWLAVSEKRAKHGALGELAISAKERV